MADSLERDLRFGPFELLSGERILRRDGLVLPLGGRALDILIYLVERPGEVVTKKELIDHAWPEVVVEEGNLRVHIAAIRKALGDGKFGNRYIANIQGRGYSFVGSLVGLGGDRKADIPKRQHEGILPARPRRIVGRDSVLRDVQESLRNERFVTLLGPGGIGKTTIAVAVGHALAEEFGGEVYFVDLGNVADPDHVAKAIGTSLGLVLRSSDPGVELFDLVRSRRLLIIIDSCEHVIEAAASLAEHLCQGAAQVYLLATSRELMRVEGEHCYRVHPLDFPHADTGQTAEAMLHYPAVQLFVERVAARGASFMFSDREAPFVADMCRRLDGLPLAIELAAGPVAALGVKSAAARLVSRLELLKLGHRTVVPRQQTLKATLDWSYDLLSDRERIVFRRLACFVGHFALEAAEIVVAEGCLADGEVLDAVAGLVEKSLIAAGFDNGEPQYRLLDTTRAYALEKLEEYAEADAILRRHAEYFANYLESQQEPLASLPKAERTAAYSRQLSNVRTALEWSFGPNGDDEIATRIAAASTRLFLELSLLIECRVWAERAVVRLGHKYKNSSRDLEISTSLSLALMYSKTSIDLVRRAFSRALDVAAIQENAGYELQLLSGLSRYCRWKTDISAALDIAARGKEVALKTKDHDDMALAETMLGASHHLAGNHLFASEHFESGLGHAALGWRFRAGQHLFHHSSILLVGMARSMLFRALLDDSLDYAKRAIEEAEKSDHPATLCRSLRMVLPVFLTLADSRRSEHYIAQLAQLATIHSLEPYRAQAAGLRGQWLLLQNDLREGVALLREALRELDAHHDALNMDFVCDLGAGLVVMGEHQEALKLILKAIDVQQRGGRLLHMPALLRIKGLVFASRSAKEYAEAEESLLSAIDLAKRQSATLFELTAATDLAELLLKQGRVTEAYKYLGAAFDRMPAGIASPVSERARQILDRPRSGIKAVG
jgi:predicted ATPase/DNA-binding winged helix-turn-helix (wHTH) protein